MLKPCGGITGIRQGLAQCKMHVDPFRHAQRVDPRRPIQQSGQDLIIRTDRFGEYDGA